MNKKKEYFQLAKSQLEQQRQNMDALNAKVNTLLVISGILIVFLGEIASRGNNILGGVFLGAGIPFLLTAMVVLLIAYRVIEWKQGPNIDRIQYDIEKNINIDEFYIEAIEALTKCYEENEEKEQKKSFRINLSAVLIMWGAFVNIVGIVLFFIFLS